MSPISLQAEAPEPLVSIFMTRPISAPCNPQGTNISTLTAAFIELEFMAHMHRATGLLENYCPLDLTNLTQFTKTQGTGEPLVRAQENHTQNSRTPAALVSARSLKTL